MNNMNGLDEVNKQILEDLHKYQREFYDKLAPLVETYGFDIISPVFSFKKESVVGKNGGTVEKYVPSVKSVALSFSEDSDNKEVQKKHEEINCRNFSGGRYDGLHHA